MNTRTLFFGVIANILFSLVMTAVCFNQNNEIVLMKERMDQMSGSIAQNAETASGELAKAIENTTKNIYVKDDELRRSIQRTALMLVSVMDTLSDRTSINTFFSKYEKCKGIFGQEDPTLYFDGEEKGRK